MSEGGHKISPDEHESFRREFQAANLLKDLNHKYGTRGKSPKHVFLQAFQERKKTGRGLFDDLEGNNCVVVESRDHGFQDDTEGEYENLDISQPMGGGEEASNAPMAKLLERPAAMVTQSKFVHRLEEQVRLEIARTSCSAPPYEMSWLYTEIRADGIKADTGVDLHSVHDPLEESEEKMMARLKIYRRAFSALILHFEAYRPLLRDIKKSYDSVLALRERQVKDVTMVKKNIHHLELSLDEKMSTVRFEGYKQLAEMEKQSFLLMRHVDRQDLAMRTMSDILNRLETSLSEEHDLRRDSEDQRRLLIVEINEIRRKLGMAPRALVDDTKYRVEEEEEENGEDEVITTEDPIILRRALEITRKNLSDAHQRLTVLEADYADVIPRHDFEELKVTMSTLESEHKKTMETYDTLNAQIQGLKDQIEKLTGERNKLRDIETDLRKKATPRPSWEKIADNIEGGLPRWQTLIAGKSSAEIVPTLIQELTGRKLLGPPEYIQPQGTALTVPKFLRHEHQVRLRSFSKRDVLVVLQDIWTSRAEELDLLRRYLAAKEEDSYSSSTSSDLPDTLPILAPFQDYLADYFTNRFHLELLRMEWAYNVVETCRKLGGIEPRLKQFLEIVEGRADEAVYHLFRAQIGKLRNAVIAKSEETGVGVGSIQFGHFAAVLEETFPDKTKDQNERLLKSASKQTGVNADFTLVKYITFFAMTDEGLAGLFVEEFGRQFEEDRSRYAYEILGELLADLGVSLSSAERENDPAGETDVSIMQLYSALTLVDPSLPDDNLGGMIAWIFMGSSFLPGAQPKGVRLIDYIKQKIRLAEFHQNGEEGDDDDDDFERALKDLLSEKEVEEMEELQGKSKRKLLQKKKITNLRTVVKRLKGAAFLRHGPRYPVGSSPTEIAVGAPATLEPPTKADKNDKRKESTRKESVKKEAQIPAPTGENDGKNTGTPEGEGGKGKEKKKKKAK